ncbi:MAG: hypothetical protein ACI841_003853 [Planctomycetota bacterium]|jgi:hypothetical protein
MNPIFGKEIAQVLSELSLDIEPLKLAKTLRKHLPSELARSAQELHLLRLRGRRRFDNDFLPYLNAKGLEQATPQAIASARADSIRARVGSSVVWDATCGVGSDSVAMHRAGIDVVSSDLDPKNCQFARANLFAQRERVPSPSLREPRVIVADARHRAVHAEHLVLDPDRRARGTRSLEPAAWSPSFRESVELASRFDGACLKLAPALAVEQVEDELDLLHKHERDLSWEWTSWRGSLIELTLWTGALAQEGDRGELRHVHAVDREGLGHRCVGVPQSIDALAPEALGDIEYLAEPDPALIRSGLLGLIAAQEGLAPIAPRCAYLGGSQPATSPLLTNWKVVDSCSLDRKRVRSMLSVHGIGPVTVKKRGHPDSSEVLERKYRGQGDQRGVLAVARLERGHIAFLLSQMQAAI